MTNKALVELMVPAADRTFDVFIPLDSRMSVVRTLISSVVNEMSEGKFKANDSTVLCDPDSGAILDVNMLATDLGIKNGSRLMLI